MTNSFLVFNNRKKIFVEEVILYSILVLAITKIIITAWTLNKGLTFTDEAWYLYLLKDIPSNISASNFFKFFGNIFNGDILLIRISVFITDLISIIVFSFGFFKYLKYKYGYTFRHFLMITAYCSIGFHLCTISVCEVFSYITMNRELMLISYGIFFLALKEKSGKKYLYYVISGFFAGCLFFIMITNIPLILFVLFVIYFETRKVSNISFYLFGVILSFIFYFLFIESFGVFYENIVINAVKTTLAESSDNHGLFHLIKWIETLLLVLINSILLPILALFGLQKIKSNQNRLLYWLFVIATIIYSLIYFKNYVYGNANGWLISSILPILICGIYIGFVNYFSKRKVDLSILLFLLIGCFTPVFLSFGTDVPFTVRGAEYLMFILPVIYILILELKQSYKLHLLFFAIVVLYVFNSFTFPYKTNWGHILFTEQNTNVSELGINQSIKLNESRINDLKNLQIYLHENEKVVLSNQSLWGYAYLLNLNPVDYSFRNEQNNINVRPIVYFEDVNKPFDIKINMLLRDLNAECHNIDNKFNVYIIDN